MKEDFHFIKPSEIRVRFAPATTGYLHIGGARTALFNFLFARKYQGTFVLRIEDTDKERSKPEFEKDILESLTWLGIQWDEGPDIGGNFGPYRQSERGEIYKKYLQKLLEEKKAYFCFCSEEELEAQRQYQLSIGLPPRYNGKCRQLSEKEVKENIEKGKRWVIRFKVEPKKVLFEDLIRGKIEIDASLIGDFVIAKSFTEPLYNFACVVDDFEMKITHVIRGEDHISNTPKQILLQEALGFPHPQYAHLPLILGPDRSKLSKRHGAVSISEYRKLGYLPEAIINFIAFLGWSPASEKEFFSLPALIKEFSIERIQKSGAVFNIKKLDFLNGFYIRQKSIEKLTELCLPYLVEAGFIQPLFEKESVPGLPSVVVGKEIVQNYIIIETKEKISLEKIQKIVSLYQERLKKLSEIPQLVDFFFKEKLEYPKELLRWKGMNDEELKLSLDRSEKILSKLEENEWTRDNLLNILVAESEKFAEEIKKGKDRGYLLWPLRVALTGKEASAGPFEIAEILGKEKTLKRIREAKELLK
jgi:nondiscriminating glutamyl-tRNA synthetase